MVDSPQFLKKTVSLGPSTDPPVEKHPSDCENAAEHLPSVEPVVNMPTSPCSEGPCDEGNQSDEEEISNQELLRALHQEVKRLSKDLRTLKDCMKYESLQTPFQQGQSDIRMATHSCRATLFRCSYGGIYLSLPLEDIDAFLAAEAAQNLESNAYDSDSIACVKKDWLNTIALADIQVDCRAAGEGRRDLVIPNGEKSYHIAALCSEGFVLGRTGTHLSDGWLPSVIEFRPFNRLLLSGWTYEFPSNEVLTLCSISTTDTVSGFVATISQTTSSYMLRLYSLGGNLLSIETVNRPMCVASSADILACLYMDKVPSPIIDSKCINPLKVDGKQIKFRFNTHPPFTSSYRVKIWRVNPESAVPVEIVEHSECLELYDDAIKWFSVSDDTKTPTLLTEKGSVYVLGYTAVSAGFIPRDLTTFHTLTPGCLAFHSDHSQSESCLEICLTKFTDNRIHEAFRSGWVCVSSQLDTIKVKNFVVHRCTSNSLEIVPAGDTFSCQSITVIPYQFPLCLPPPMIALLDKYPITLNRRIEYYTLQKEERSAKGFNPFTSHLFDESSIRHRLLVVLPVLRMASWRNAVKNMSGELVDTFIDGRTQMELSSTQSALIALQERNPVAFRSIVRTIGNKKALDIIRKHVLARNDATMLRMWEHIENNRPEEYHDVVNHGGEDFLVRPSLSSSVKNVVANDSQDSTYATVSVKENKSSQMLKQPATVQNSSLSQLINGSIELRNNVKKRLRKD